MKKIFLFKFIFFYLNAFGQSNNLNQDISKLFFSIPLNNDIEEIIKKVKSDKNFIQLELNLEDNQRDEIFFSCQFSQNNEFETLGFINYFSGGIYKEGHNSLVTYFLELHYEKKDLGFILKKIKHFNKKFKNKNLIRKKEKYYLDSRVGKKISFYLKGSSLPILQLEMRETIKDPGDRKMSVFSLIIIYILDTEKAFLNQK